MVDPDEIQEWLKKADEDRKAAEILLNSGEELTLPSLFHLQQMLEKLLKTLIIARGDRAEKTHDLGHLAQMAGVQNLEGLLNLCDTLSLFAVHSRYPGDLPGVGVREAWAYYEEAVSFREELIRRIATSI